MSNFHISKDGVARQCRAATPESCKATPADSKEHFDTKEAAQKSFESFMKSKEVPKTLKIPKTVKKSSSKGDTSNPKQEVPKPASKKKVVSKTMLEGIEKLKEFEKLIDKDVHDKISTHKTFVILTDITLDRTLSKPKTPAQMQKVEIAYSDRIEAFENVLEKMKKNGSFTTESINEIEDLAYNRKVDSGTARLDYFYAHRNNIKKQRFFHNDGQRAEIEKHNAAVRKEEQNSIENFKGLIADFPEGCSKERAEEKLRKVKEDFPQYAHLMNSEASDSDLYSLKKTNKEKRKLNPKSSQGIVAAFSKGTGKQEDYDAGMEDSIEKMSKNLQRFDSTVLGDYYSYPPIEINGVNYQHVDFDDSGKGKSALFIFKVNGKSFIASRDDNGSWAKPRPYNFSAKLDHIVHNLNK